MTSFCTGLVVVVLLAVLVQRLGRRAIRPLQGRVAFVHPDGTVDIELEDASSPSPGGTFVVYRRMTLRELDTMAGDARRTHVALTPVGRARVEHATVGMAHCRYRPERGTSTLPRRGDPAALVA